MYVCGMYVYTVHTLLDERTPQHDPKRPVTLSYHIALTTETSESDDTMIR